MHRIIGGLIALTLTMLSQPSSARFIQGDPLGVVPVTGQSMPPVPGAPMSGQNTHRATTATDVLSMRGLNHSYAYVSGNPLKYTDPAGLQQTYGLPWVMPPNYIPIQQTSCECPGPNADPQVAGNIIGGSMLSGSMAGAVGGGVTGVTIASGEAGTAIGGLVVADAAASGAIAGGIVGGAIGTVVGVGIAGVYYYRSNNNSCNACCPRWGY